MTAISNAWSNGRNWSNAFTWSGDAWAQPGMVVGHRYITRARFTAGSEYLLATEDGVHNAEIWWGVLQAQAELSSQFVAGEITAGQRLRLGLLYREGETDALFTAYAAGSLIEGFNLQVTVTTILTGIDGNELVFDRTRWLTCVGIEVRDGLLQLELGDIVEARLDTLYPPHSYLAADWPDLRTDDAGRAIPRPVGTALQLPLVLIDTDDATFWDYGVCEYSGTAPTVLTVYRDGRIVDASEYTAQDNTSGSLTVRAVRFVAEQVDYSGRAYPLTADVQTTDSRNAIDEIDRLLVHADMSLTAHTASSARAYGTANSMLVDCDYGRDGQRTIRAILDDLLLIARATLLRNWTEATKFDLIQDRGDAPSQTLDQTLGDALVIQRLYSKARPTKVSISYRPAGDDPSRMQHPIERTVTGGSEGVQQPRVLRYLRDHTAADRLLCYLALRAQYARHVQLQLKGPHADAGNVLSLTGRFLPADFRCLVQSSRQRGTTLEIEAVEDAAAVHVYTPGTLPSDATDDYAPDYSRTPPAAPTSLTVTDGGSASGADRQAWSYVALSCVPPAVNWSEIWLVAVHATTGEMAMARAEADGAVVRGVLNGLRTEEVYAIKAYAVSPFGLDGLAQSTTDATFIGQSATAATIIAPGSAIEAPLAPTGLVITSGGFAAGDDRRVFSYITVEAELPSNAVELWMVAVHNSTGERIDVRAELDAGIDYIATIPGLRAAEVYRLEVYAVGAFGNRGAAASTVDATAIGGGAAVTTWTAPGTQLAAPAAPSSLTITAGAAATGDDRRGLAWVEAFFVTTLQLATQRDWVEGRLRAIHNSTGEAIEVTAPIISTPSSTPYLQAILGAAITGLRAGEVYRLEGYLVNAFGQAGAADITADATAIGGGASTATWTAPGAAVGLPATPTSLAVSSSGTRRAGDGGITAWFTVSADFGASSTEVRETFFDLANNTTGEKVILRASAASGVGTATFHGLRAGEDHTLRAYGVNAFGAQGTAATTSPVTASYTTAPATVSSVTATQGMGRVINVAWPAVSDSDLGDYELERRIGAGSYSVIWRGKARSYEDISVGYGSAYQYRVRARNTSGVYSAAYATSAALTLTAGGVAGGSSSNDIGSSTVATANRTGVTTISGSGTPVAGVKALNIPHSLGRVPIIGGVDPGPYNFGRSSADSSNVTVVSYERSEETTSDVPANPHSHFSSYLNAAYTAYADIW